MVVIKLIKNGREKTYHQDGVEGELQNFPPPLPFHPAGLKSIVLIFNPAKQR
jgi:hypothetical protein